jgi:cystathionine beta-synthase
MSSGIQSVPNLLSLVGNTPLVELKKVVKGFKGNFYAKWEAFNPGHSSSSFSASYLGPVLSYKW